MRKIATIIFLLFILVLLIPISSGCKQKNEKALAYIQEHELGYYSNNYYQDLFFYAYTVTYNSNTNLFEIFVVKDDAYYLIKVSKVLEVRYMEKEIRVYTQLPYLHSVKIIKN